MVGVAFEFADDERNHYGFGRSIPLDIPTAAIYIIDSAAGFDSELTGSR